MTRWFPDCLDDANANLFWTEGEGSKMAHCQDFPLKPRNQAFLCCHGDHLVKLYFTETVNDAHFVKTGPQNYLQTKF